MAACCNLWWTPTRTQLCWHPVLGLVALEQSKINFCYLLAICSMLFCWPTNRDGAQRSKGKSKGKRIVALGNMGKKVLLGRWAINTFSFKCRSDRELSSTLFRETAIIQTPARKGYCLCIWRRRVGAMTISFSMSLPLVTWLWLQTCQSFKHFQEELKLGWDISEPTATGNDLFWSWREAQVCRKYEMQSVNRNSVQIY